MEKLRVSPWRLIWRFLLIMVVIYVVAFVFLFSVFFDVDFEHFSITAKPWELRQTLFTVGVFIIGVAAFIPSMTSYYYVIDKKYFLMRKYGKTYEFSYDNIEFIDIEKSQKKKMVIFYSKTGKMRFLLGDKKGVLLETLIKKCPNVMNKDEFRIRHPEEKY